MLSGHHSIIAYEREIMAYYGHESKRKRLGTHFVFPFTNPRVSDGLLALVFDRLVGGWFVYGFRVDASLGVKVIVPTVVAMVKRLWSP